MLEPVKSSDFGDLRRLPSKFPGITDYNYLRKAATFLTATNDKVPCHSSPEYIICLCTNILCFGKCTRLITNRPLMLACWATRHTWSHYSTLRKLFRE